MSSETDHPRQRTVAELLAEHGDAGATGRRRRRRAADDEPDEGAYDRRPAETVAPPVARRSVPDRSVLREPVPPQPVAPQPVAPQPVAPQPVAPQPRYAPEPSWNRSSPPVFPERPVVDPGRERSTDVMPRIRDDAPAVDEHLTGPLPTPSSDAVAPETEALAIRPDAEDAGPSTMIGVAPVEAQEWHRARTHDARRAGTAIDGGPALPPADVDDEPDVDEQAVRDPAPVDLEKHDDHEQYEKYDDEPPRPRERRLGRASAAAKQAAAPAWAAVMGQWVAGALGGAVLWVLFRYLWRSLPVVALASAVLVTVGLVVIVRALLHNDDRRTTLFAVLVGLLLTVSPALLVLLGR